MIPDGGSGGADFAAVLLAGGQSRRMGRDKALLPLPDGRLLWERQLGILRELGPAELFISGFVRPGFPEDVPLLADELPGRGPLGGIAAALAAMRSPRLVVLAVDLPAMTAGFLSRLLGESPDGRGIVPRHGGPNGFYEPLAAVYPVGCRTLARERLAGEDWSLQTFVRAAGGALREHQIAATEEPLFANWNAPLDSR